MLICAGIDVTLTPLDEGDLEDLGGGQVIDQTLWRPKQSTVDSRDHGTPRTMNG